MEFLNDFLVEMHEPDFLSTVIRLALALFCGGLIGLDRGRRRRPAGFRTHMLVCVGAALTMLSGQYAVLYLREVELTFNTDVSRLGAQVINGIGFLGAGTIIVTGRQEIKGLTTAAGLWASACMGLAIGAGFYFGAILACLLILFSITVMRKVESFVLARSRNMNVYVEFIDIDDIGLVIDLIKKEGIRIYDVEIHKANPGVGSYAYAIFSMRLPKRPSHSDVMAKLASVRSIRSLEEI